MKNHVTNCFVQQILKCFKDRIWNWAKNKIKPLFYYSAAVRFLTMLTIGNEKSDGNKNLKLWCLYRAKE